MQNYITKPKSVRRKEIVGREWIFSPARYKTYHINSKFDTLDNLIEISKQSINIGKQKKYFNYVEIGSINTSTGYIEPTYKRSIDILTDSVFKLQKDDILISTVRTYLGGIGIVSQDEENFVASKALIVLRDLKQNINRHYLFGVLRSSYFIEQTNLILNASMYPRMDKDSFHELKIPLPTPTSNPNPKAVQDFVGVLVQNIIDKEEQIKAKNAEIDRLIEAELYGNQKKSSFVYSMPRISEIRQQDPLDTGLYTEEFKKIDNLIKSYGGGCERLEKFVVKFYSGTTPTFFEKQNGDYPYFIRPTEFNDNRTYKDLRKIHTNPENKYRIDKDEGIILPRKGGINAILKPQDFNVIIGDSVKFAIFKNINVVFLASFLTSKLIRFILENVKSKTNGGSLTESDLTNLPIPIFPQPIQHQVARLYYNKIDKNSNLTLENYLQKEKTRNNEAGIFQLNMEIFALREKLENLVHKILMEEKIEVEFE